MSQKRILLVLASGFLLLSLACDVFSSIGEKSNSDDTQAAETNQDAGESPSTPTKKTGVNPQTTSESEDDRDTPTEGAPSTAKVGDVFRNGALRMVVLGWMELEPTKSTKPESGNRFIAVGITAVNLWEDLFTLNTYYFTIKDSESREYSKTVNIDTPGAGYTTKNIFPGDRWTGFFAFEIPVDSTGLVLVMNEDSQNEFDRVLIDLGDEQGIQNPPDSIEGEKPPDLVPAGSMATCGKWNLQVNAVFYPTIDRIYKDMITPGYKIILADLTLENTDSSSQELSPSQIFWLQEPLGLRYGQSFFAEPVTESQVQGKFFSYNAAAAAGEKIRGWIGFDIPENPVNPYLVFWCGYIESYDSVERVTLALPTG